jgi:hypothetical protein
MKIAIESPGMISAIELYSFAGLALIAQVGL